MPDNILVPTGYGSNILGLERGFDELERNGEIDRRPRLFAVQAANCAAFGAAWNGRRRRLRPVRSRPDRRRRHRHGKTGPHARGAERAIRRSGGAVVAVPEAEIAPALLALGRLGLFVEPTAATAAAAVSQLLQGGKIRRDETTIVVLTGHGLKATDKIAELLGV